MSDFSTRRDKILDVFKNAKTDLENLNYEVQESIDANLVLMQDLQEANKNLVALRQENENSIKVFSKIFKA